uniref:(California timema) hypothetical protein n=1 Tax=Timema californicum TaxID=61474 RepID=A0A7R9JJE3_TIMCA|nr:unnamed protein product [Timema californicum]
MKLKTVMAYATAEEYDLERLKAGLIKQDLYKPVLLCSGDELKHTASAIGWLPLTNYRKPPHDSLQGGRKEGSKEE